MLTENGQRLHAGGFGPCRSLHLNGEGMRSVSPCGSGWVHSIAEWIEDADFLGPSIHNPHLVIRNATGPPLPRGGTDLGCAAGFGLSRTQTQNPFDVLSDHVSFDIHGVARLKC